MTDRLLVSRRGRLSPVEGAVADGPVELAVREAVRDTGSRAGVCRRVRHHLAVRAVEGQVRARGLLVAGPRARLRWVARLLPVVLAVAGLGTALIAYRLDRQGADLTIMLVAVAVPLFWVLFGRSSAHHRPTPVGRAVLLRLERRYRVDDTGHDKRLGQAEPWDPVAAVGCSASSPSPVLRCVPR